MPNCFFLPRCWACFVGPLAGEGLAKCGGWCVFERGGGCRKTSLSAMRHGSHIQKARHRGVAAILQQPKEYLCSSVWMLHMLRRHRLVGSLGASTATVRTPVALPIAFIVTAGLPKTCAHRVRDRTVELLYDCLPALRCVFGKDDTHA